MGRLCLKPFSEGFRTLEIGVRVGTGTIECSVVDPELFPGPGIICSGSSKNERADKLKFYC